MLFPVQACQRVAVQVKNQTDHRTIVPAKPVFRPVFSRDANPCGRSTQLGLGVRTQRICLLTIALLIVQVTPRQCVHHLGSFQVTGRGTLFAEHGEVAILVAYVVPPENNPPLILLFVLREVQLCMLFMAESLQSP